MGVQTQADVTGEQFVLFLGEHSIDLLGRGPGGGAMLLAIPRPALLVCVEADAHDVGPSAGQDGHEAVFRPLDAEGVFHRRRQIGDDLRQTAVQGWGDEQRRPDHENVEEQVNGDFTCSGCLFQ